MKRPLSRSTQSPFPGPATGGNQMHSIFYIIGVVVVVLAAISFIA
jgi:hypothetical protein